MRIVELKLHFERGWPALEWKPIERGLNAIYGPRGSGKTTLTDVLAEVLFGRQSTRFLRAESQVAPQGEIVVECGEGRYQLRRHRDDRGATRLTVAALDGSPVDQSTIRRLVQGLSPTVLSPLCAVSFGSTPDIGRLLSQEFAREIESIGGIHPGRSSRRTAELAARRDLLAQELETRIAGERRISKELDGRWRELDRLVRHEQQQSSSQTERLHAVETALAETDARLRYRRLELNTELRWQTDGPGDDGPRIADLDAQIERWRATLNELGEREARVRGQLTKIQPARATSALSGQRAWLAMARQLAADFVGEVARLARASESQQCVCRDAHPRLRPIAETVQRQLDGLESLIQEHDSAAQAAGLRQEIEHLCRTQSELRRHVDFLLDRRQATANQAGPYQPTTVQPASGPTGQSQRVQDEDGRPTFSAADAEQLEGRRIELEQERFELVGQLRAQARKLRDLRAQRETVERQRAALLSARSIEHVQRELAVVQRKLEQAAGGEQREEFPAIADNRARASDYLAQLTDGALVRLMLVEKGRRACVVNRAGETLCVESLSETERDQVYLSLCLALLSLAAQEDIWLPLVLDDPFVRLDARGTAALAAVLDDFGRQGHQVLVLTGQREAAERLASLGTTVHDIADLRPRQPGLAPAAEPCAPGTDQSTGPALVKKRKREGRVTVEKRKKRVTGPAPNGKASDSGRSDAA